eukprot:NODE_155_length_16773_cov_0.488785.p3 type:complete len:468 gc:universal NODE_155_length_16773_cov_0.488785:14684-16087(+)
MFLEAVYVATFSILIALGIFALYQSRHYQNKTKSDYTSPKKHSTIKVMWSMYSASVGSWVSVAPSQYASFAGILGLVMYAFSSAIPISIVSVMSGKMSESSSMNEYIGKRFGKHSQVFVIIVSILNMGIALVAEYTTIGSIFQNVVQSSPVPSMILIGLVTMSYTSIGGVAVSVVTDQVLAVLTMILLLTTLVYILVNFRPILPPLPASMGINEAGLSSILTMPVSMISSTIFSESMWQRVEASENRRSLYISAFFASIIVFIVLMFYGLVGFFVTWAELSADPNTLFFHIFSDTESWIAVVSIVISSMMSQSAIDSLQNALVASVCSNIIPCTISFARFAVFLINVPAILISLQMYPIMNLYLMVNLITASCVAPLLLGLLDIQYYRGWAFIASCLMGMLGVSLVGIIETGSLTHGMQLSWIGNEFNYKYFVAALTVSAGCVFLFSTILGALQRKTFSIPATLEKL